MELDCLQLKMCDIQGRLFEKFASLEYDSEDLIKRFMRSELAANLDSVYNRMQWAGEEYLLDELLDEQGEFLNKGNDCYPQEVLYWAGYLYRFWHYYTGESSKKIYQWASARTMRRNYLMFHTMTPELAVDDLKEIHKQKRK